jgi:hypothetical protein
MNCPACGLLEARVERTILGPKVDRRQRTCRCGVTWNTTERIDAGSIRVKGENPNAHQGHAIKRAAESSRERDLPGINSSSLQASSDLDPNASLLSEPRARVERRGRPSTGEYTPEFEAFWSSLTIRRGNKLPAFKAWVKLARGISPELIFTRYQQWQATPQWLDGFAPYVSTWLNAKGWESEPGAADFKPRRNGVPQRIEESREATREWTRRSAG